MLVIKTLSALSQQGAPFAAPWQGTAFRSLATTTAQRLTNQVLCIHSACKLASMAECKEKDTPDGNLQWGGERPSCPCSQALVVEAYNLWLSLCQGSDHMRPVLRQDSEYKQATQEPPPAGEPRVPAAGRPAR